MRSVLLFVRLLTGLFEADDSDSGGTWDPWGGSRPHAGGMWDPLG
jgi:hypothetical protein